VSPNENNRRAAALKKLAATPPAAGTNVILVTHKPNILDAFGKDWFDVREGEASIFKPDGKGGFTLVGRVQAADWAKQHGVPLICNEFGVFRTFSDPQDRSRWLTDVRITLERHNIGWAMWDYSGSFGVVTNRDTKAKLDEVTVQALGLTMPAGQ